MTIGFIGLGIMGKPMAKHLLQQGKDLMVNDISQPAVQELEALGAKAGTYSQIGSQCDLVITILPSGPIVREVLLGSGGVAESIKPGAIVVDHSSVTPTESREFANALAEKDVSFIDAPVSGGEAGAIEGKLAIMAGGDPRAIDRVSPEIAPYTASLVRIGDVGAGSIAKLANQIIVNNTIAVVSEALVFAKKAGADPLKVYQAIRGGLAGSAVLDAKAPRMVEGDFKPGGSLTINHKDIKNVIATAHDADVPVPYSAQLFEILQSLKVHGHMGDDHGGIVQYFEELAGITLRD